MTQLETNLAWVTAIGTLLAAVVPGVLYWLERRARIEAQNLARAAQGRAEALETRALTAQVRRIRVSADLSQTVLDLTGGPERSHYSSVTARNASDDAVFEVTVGGHPVFQERPIEVLEPGQSESVPAMVGHPVPAGQRPDVWVQFTDGGGRQWKRYASGTVEEVTPTSGV